MKRLYFSGIEKSATAHVLRDENARGMISQILYSDKLIDACEGIELMMDSSAYSIALGRKEIEKYASIIMKLDTRCIEYVAPDVIGDQEQSNENYKYLLSLLPHHLHSRILWVYQQSADMRYLLEGMNGRTRIGVGGLVPLLKHRKEACSHISNIAGIARHLDVHYFGVSDVCTISVLHGIHDSFSVDSTTWLSGGKYGLLIDKYGRQRSASQEGFDFTTAAILSQNVRTMRRWVESKRETKCIPSQMRLFT